MTFVFTTALSLIAKKVGILFNFTRTPIDLSRHTLFQSNASHVLAFLQISSSLTLPPVAQNELFHYSQVNSETFVTSDCGQSLLGMQWSLSLQILIILKHFVEKMSKITEMVVCGDFGVLQC